MLKRQIGAILLVTCLILTTVPAALGAQNSITVSPTSGSSAQTAINDAIDSVASGATSSNPGYVILSAGTYQISAPIILKSNVVLKGAGDSTIIYATSSVCNSASSPAYVYGSGVSNVEVSNLQFKSSATGTSDGGHGDYRNCIKFSSVSNGKVHDILFTRYLYGDGVRIGGSSGIEVYNCKIKSSGHDGVSFLSSTKNSRMYNCYVEVQTNTGVRVDNCANIEVDHNTFTGSAGSGWCCVELENTLTSVDVHHNIMHDFKGSSSSAGVGDWNAAGSISVRDNVMWNVSPYVEVGSGTNILGPSDQNVDNWVAKGYGYGSLSSSSSDSSSSDSSSSDSSSSGSSSSDSSSSDSSSSDSSSSDSSSSDSSSSDSSSSGSSSSDSSSSDSSSSDSSSSGSSSSEDTTTDHTSETDSQSTDNGSSTSDNQTTTDNAADTAAGNGSSTSDDQSSTDNAADTTAGNGSSTSDDQTTTDNTGATADNGSSTSNNQATTDNAGANADSGSSTSNAQATTGNTCSATCNTCSTTGNTCSATGNTCSTTDCTCLTKENVTGTIIDNRLREASPNTVYQDKTYIDIGGRPKVGRYRDLILFNLSEYTDAENITNATLSLYWYYPDGKERPEDAVVEIYRPAEAWSPENVTWNSRDNGIVWTNAGGDWFDANNTSQGAIPYATITLNGSDIPDNRYYELNVTDLVKEYVSGEYENTGFLIKTRNETADYVAFRSSDVEDENQRPILTIEKKA